jgi:hypothetical protein
VSEREDFDAWFQRRYSCSNFNGSWEATAAMGHAWNGWQERVRRTVSADAEKDAALTRSQFGDIVLKVCGPIYLGSALREYDAAILAAKEKKS